MPKARFASSVRSEAVMGEMNTTPLIDVMLVLLIMFIITVPVQTHSVDLDLPNGSPPNVPQDNVRNMVTIAPDDQYRWNGYRVSDEDMRALLVAAATNPARPELHLRPDEFARYERVDQLLAEAKRAGTTKLGFVGNEQHQTAF